MKIFIYDDKIPLAFALGGLVLCASGVIWASVSAQKHSLYLGTQREALIREELRRETELAKIETNQILSEASAKLPDPYSVVIHEWDCSTGSLVVPSRTLGNPKLKHILPAVGERPLTQADGVTLAGLLPDGQINYTKARELGCPPQTGSFVLFGEPLSDEARSITPQFKTR